jgi:hypothetical protein
MISLEKDRAVNSVITTGIVRIRKIVKAKDEIMYRILKDLF